MKKSVEANIYIYATCNMHTQMYSVYEFDTFNCNRCLINGYNNYTMGYLVTK